MCETRRRRRRSKRIELPESISTYLFLKELSTELSLNSNSLSSQTFSPNFNNRCCKANIQPSRGLFTKINTGQEMGLEKEEEEEAIRYVRHERICQECASNWLHVFCSVGAKKRANKMKRDAKKSSPKRPTGSLSLPSSFISTQIQLYLTQKMLQDIHVYVNSVSPTV